MNRGTSGPGHCVGASHALRHPFEPSTCVSGRTLALLTWRGLSDLEGGLLRDMRRSTSCADLVGLEGRPVSASREVSISSLALRRSRATLLPSDTRRPETGPQAPCPSVGKSSRLPLAACYSCCSTSTCRGAKNARSSASKTESQTACGSTLGALLVAGKTLRRPKPKRYRRLGRG